MTCRGIPVGRVTSVGLSSDATTVEARVFIRPEHRQLVRKDSRLWSISGIEVDLGWTGVRMDVESLATVAAGGVALATPDPPGEHVTTGDRFELDAAAPEDWCQWQPRIPIGSTLLPHGLVLPQPMRAALRWRERNYVGLARERQLDGWVLAIDGDRLIGPGDLLVPGKATTTHGSIALYEIPEGGDADPAMPLPLAHVATRAPACAGETRGLRPRR